MRKYGLDKFILEILKLNPEEGDEERFIREYDSYNNGYNLSINGLGYTYEGEYIQFFNKVTHEQVKVRDFEADRYLQDENWERGNINMKGQIWINNGIDCIRIRPEEYNNYDKSEWKIGNLNLIGNSHTLGKIWINNGDINKVVTESEFISEWEPKGWKRGGIKGRISINKGGINKMIFPDELDKYKSEGWKIGQGYVASSKGRIHITDGIHNKMIYPEDLQKYEYDGWRVGRTMNKSSKGKIIINNELLNKMIPSENFLNTKELDGN